MATKKCCNSKVCECELSVNFTHETGWGISTNAPFFKTVFEKYITQESPEYVKLGDYITIGTKNQNLIRNIISDLEE